MVFNARAHAKYRAIGFYGELDTEASFSKSHSFCSAMASLFVSRCNSRSFEIDVEKKIAAPDD
jgi:hypothetical protein